MLCLPNVCNYHIFVLSSNLRIKIVQLCAILRTNSVLLNQPIWELLRLVLFYQLSLNSAHWPTKSGTNSVPLYLLNANSLNSGLKSVMITKLLLFYRLSLEPTNSVLFYLLTLELTQSCSTCSTWEPNQFYSTLAVILKIRFCWDLTKIKK